MLAKQGASVWLLSSDSSSQAANDGVFGGEAGTGDRDGVELVSVSCEALEGLAVFGRLSRGDEAALLLVSLGGGDCVTAIGGCPGLAEGGEDPLGLPGGGEEVSGAGPCGGWKGGKSLDSTFAWDHLPFLGFVRSTKSDLP